MGCGGRRDGWPGSGQNFKEQLLPPNVLADGPPQWRLPIASGLLGLDNI